MGDYYETSDARLERDILDHRELILHAAMIRAAFCVSRGLSLSQACTPPGCRICGAIDAPACEQCSGPFYADEAQRLAYVATAADGLIESDGGLTD